MLKTFSPFVWSSFLITLCLLVYLIFFHFIGLIYSFFPLQLKLDFFLNLFLVYDNCRKDSKEKESQYQQI